MSILDTLAARLGYSKAAKDKPPDEMLAMADGYRWEMPMASDAEKQMRLYAALTWIATAIDRTAEIAASGVFSVQQIANEPDGADDEDLPNHEFEKLLYRPNPSQSRGEFLRDAFTMYRVTGNLYLFSNAPDENAPPDELWIVPSHMIVPIPDGRSYIAGYAFTPPTGKTQIIEPWQIVHLKTANPLNPFVGLSAVQSLALDAYGDLAQQKWNLGLFEKNAGKFPGILAFKHMVADPEWKKMTETRDKEWGGTTRAQIMMLRGVGDAVQWLPAALSQKEMEFLASRNFTKEEIFGKLAPGLASILAVNATEANAIAGKSTLIEFGVWPTLVQLAEKFSAFLLPLYGENLRGEFEDMRQTNRILDMEELKLYSTTHTVNQINAEYYDEGPLELDPSQIEAIETEEAEAEEQKEQALTMLNSQPAQPKPKPTPFGKAAPMPTDKPKSKLDPRGFMFPIQISPTTVTPGEKKPAPPPAFGGQPPGQPPMAQQEGDALPNDDEKAELKAWENFALKRLGKPGGREFEARHVDVFTAGRIKAGLAKATTRGDVQAVFEREYPGGDVMAAAVRELRRWNDSSA